MAFRDKTRKTITLPSGATTTIRRVTARDFLGVKRGIPLAISPEKSRKPESVESDLEIEHGMVLMTMYLTRCVGTLVSSDGEKAIIVDKPFAQCGDGELSVDEIDQADAQYICDEVATFSGLSKAAQEAAKTFPEGQEVSPLPTPNS